MDASLYQRASTRLTWETLEEWSARPILNLSARDDSPEGIREKEMNFSSLPTDVWDRHWKDETLPGLEDIGVLVNESYFLERCPHLLRLEPALVLETASWLAEKFGARYVSSEPRLLGFRQADVAYGVEFLSTMMMIPDATPACSASPALFLTGIEGGIQEQAVQRALGAAGSASAAATQKIAGDAIQTWNQLRQRKREKS